MKRLALLVILLFSLASFASTATPVTISSIAVAGTVATVTTSTAHSIPSNNPGFCILGVTVQTVDNVCGAAATVPSSTTYTFNFPTGVTILACASSCGTSQPAPLLAIRGNATSCALGSQCVSFCEYVFAPVAVPLANATTACASAFTTAAFGSNAATVLSEMNAALASGQIVERFQPSLPFPALYTVTSVQNKILDIQLSDQTAFAAANAPGLFTGHPCDVTGCN